MRRHHGAQVQLRYLQDRDYFDSTELQMKQTLAALHRLLPNRQHLPGWISNSKQFEDIAQLVQCEVRNTPADVQEQAAVVMAQLQYCLGVQLFQFIDLPQTCFGSHPHWCNRIKRVKEVLASLEPVAGSDHSMTCMGRGIALSSRSLSQYQADDIWHPALERSSLGSIHAWFELKQIRRCSPKQWEELASIVNLELFDQATKDVAWGEAMARNEAAQ